MGSIPCFLIPVVSGKPMVGPRRKPVSSTCRARPVARRSTISSCTTMSAQWLTGPLTNSTQNFPTSRSGWNLKLALSGYRKVSSGRRVYTHRPRFRETLLTGTSGEDQ